MTVNVTYREPGAVVPGSTIIKNSPLSNAEIDGNFKSVKDAVEVLSTTGGAALIGVAPVGGVAATTVQAAISELDSEKAGLTTLAAPSGASLVGYGTGSVKTALDAVTGPTGAASVGYTPAGTGAVATTVQSKLRETVSVKDFGAVGNGIADDTAAIQAAINYTVVNNIVVNGRPCSVFFPHGTYKVTDTINIPGAVALLGDGAPMSISGARVLQHSANKSLFSVVGATNAAIYIDGLMLKDVSGTANQSVGLFHADATTTSGNSFYLKNTWFSTPSYYAINILCQSDDLQIVDCTFDVTAQKFINLGSASKIISNFSIRGCTFYAGFSGLGFIDIINAQAGVISGNRFYEGGAFDIPYAISLPNALSSNIIIDSNTCIGLASLVKTQSGSLTVSNNSVAGGGSSVAVGGGSPVSGLVITGNYFKGSSGASFGVIDCTGTPIANSVITGNVINGNASSGYALKLELNSYAGNIICDNAVTGCTTNGAGSGSWTPTVSGTATSGTISYTSQVGRWEIKGNQVTVNFSVAINAVTVAPTGQLIVAGLPFSNGATTYYGIVQANTLNYPAGGYAQTGLDIQPSQSAARVLFSGNNLALNVNDASLVAAGDSFNGQITYSLV